MCYIVSMDTLELPMWLAPAHTTHNIDDTLPRFPLTREQIEIEQLVFEAVFQRFLDGISEGQPPKAIIANDPRNISYGRFIRWVRKDPARLERFEEAQELGTETLAADMIEIADAANSAEDVQRSALRVNTRWKLMQAWNRKRYGEKQQVDVTNTTTISIKNLLEQREQRLHQITNAPIEGESRRVD